MIPLNTALSGITGWASRTRPCKWDAVYLAELEEFPAYYLVIKKHPKEELYRTYLGSTRTGSQYNLCTTNDLVLGGILGYEQLLRMEEPPIQ